MRKSICFIFLIVILCSNAFAKVYELGEIVVYGDKTKTQDITQRDTITEDDIKKTNSRTISDVFKYVPGIIVTKNAKNEADIRVHGLGQDKTSVFIDGIPYYETKYGIFNLDQIPAEIISKIVVEKGASSVLYGAGNAIATINIITKDADLKKTSFKCELEFGENNTNNINLSLNKSFEKFKYWINVNHKESDGWDMSDHYDVKDGKYGYYNFKNNQDYYTPVLAKDGGLEDGGLRNNSDYESNSIWARLGFIPDKTSEYYLNFNYLKSEKGMPHDIRSVLAYSDFTKFSRSENYEKIGIDLSAKHDINEIFTLKEKFFYHTHKDDYLSYETQNYSKLLATSTYNDNLTGFSILPEFYFSLKHNLNFSVHYKEDTHKERSEITELFKTYKSKTSSIGAEYNFFPNEKLKTTIGASYDNFKVTDIEGDNNKPDINTFNPMAGINYEINDKYSIFTSIAQKTKFPTLEELYHDRYGNDSLNEEDFINYTIGTNGNITKNIKFDFSLFYHDLKNRIIRDINDKNKYKNVGQEKVKGYEAGVSLICPKLETLKFDINFVYNNAKNKSKDRTTDKMLGIPEKQLKIGLEYVIPRINVKLNLNSLYTGQQYAETPERVIVNLDSFWVHDTRISKEINKNTNIYISANNIFDKNYEEEYGFPSPGRSIFMGLSYKY
ncbi:MAG: hypothetical protein B6I26_02855 [Desulfobacteraceae bacterium 4572_130]|nr:MAG: hypothetical protein B6I26_02855 [Desulfobacteraceae bacterium 4572_130]